MNTSISPIQGENIKIHGNSPRVSSTVALTYPPDEFIKSAPMKDQVVGCRIVDDIRNGNNENEMVNILKDEYQSIKRENYETYEEYKMEKDAAYKRWQEAIENASKNSNERHTTNGNVFSNAWKALCEGIKNAGNTILEFLPFFNN